ncbi:hypothetical protein ACTXT7_016594, partial [Hymenolepis weldensis]
MDLSVMSVVEMIFTWVLQCINGGVLNVFFTAQLNTTTKEYNYKLAFDSQKLLNYIKGVLLLKGEDLPLDILNTFPENIGGGPEGVRNAKENPNREVYFIAGPLGVALIMLIAILGLLFISCCTCCTKKGRKSGRNKKRKGRKYKSEENEDGQGNGQNPNQSQDEARDGSGKQDHTENRYGNYYYSESESDSEVDGDFECNVADYDEDGNPKGFKENLRGLFLFYKSSVFGSKVEERQAEILDEIEELMDKNSFTRKHQACICYGCHLLSLLLALIYIVALFICIVIYLMAAQQLAEVMGQPPENETTTRNEVIAWTSGASTHFNFPGTVSFILREVVNLLNDSVTSLLGATKSTIDSLTTKLMPTIDEGVNSTFNLLLQDIRAIDLFNQTEYMAEKFIDFNKHVQEIDENRNNTVPELNKLHASFEGIHKELQKTQPGLADLNLIKFDFDGSKVAPVVGSQYIKQFVGEFANFAKQLESLKLQLTSLPSRITDQIKQQLDLSQYYTQIETQLNGLINRTEPQIENVAKTITKHIQTAQPYITPALYAPAGLMILITVAFFVCFMLFITEACRLRILSCTGEGPSE